MKQNQDYKNAALAALKGNWPQALVATIIFLALAGIIFGPMEADNFRSIYGLAPIIPGYASFTFTLATIFIFYPLSVGYANSFRALLDTGDNRITSNTFSMGFGNWLHVSVGMLITYIYVVLWSLLFIIPGIIKVFSYAMTPFILVERPELSFNEAIDESRRLMDGHKFDYFYLMLSFIGWWILSILSLGIGFIWLMPYMETASAAFYADIKEEKGGGVLEGERVL